MASEQCVGILLPDDGPDDYEWYTLDTVLEHLPAMHVAGVTSDGLHTPEALTDLGSVARLLPQAESLVAQGCGAVIWACTSASFIGGLDWARRQRDALADALGVPASSTALAVRDLLRAAGWTRIDLLGPYPDEVTQRLSHFLAESGIEVRDVHSLDNLYARDSHDADIPGALRAFGRRRRGPPLPIMIPDTAVNTLGRWQQLNELAKVPVITANQATLWKALQLVDWPRPWPHCVDIA